MYYCGYHQVGFRIVIFGKEIMMKKDPFEGIPPATFVQRFVEEKLRLRIPVGCSEEMAEIMTECWAVDFFLIKTNLSIRKTPTKDQASAR